MLSAAQGEQALAYFQLNTGSGFGNSLIAQLNLSGSTMTIWLGAKADRFTVSGSTYTNTEGNGATLSLSGTIYTYTQSDGTVVTFDQTYSSSASDQGHETSMVRPDGSKLIYSYASARYCKNSKPLTHPSYSLCCRPSLLPAASKRARVLVSARPWASA